MARYRLPLTIRIAFYAVRAAWTALIIAAIAWIWLVPASAIERNALNAKIGQERPVGLSAMRIARVMVHFAPDRAARMLSDASDGELSPELAGMLLRQIASGHPEQPVTPADDETPNTGGAKFIRVN